MMTLMMKLFGGGALIEICNGGSQEVAAAVSMSDIGRKAASFSRQLVLDNSAQCSLACRDRARGLFRPPLDRPGIYAVSLPPPLGSDTAGYAPTRLRRETLRRVSVG
jgi:hypothetical protein